MPPSAFILAVSSHILHNLSVYNATGLNFLTMILTLSGFILILVIIVWSLQRQRHWLRTELENQIPPELYRTVIRTSSRAKAQWQALFVQGYQGWRRRRHLHQLCSELAIKLRQSRLFPDERGFADEAKALILDIDALLEEI